MHGWSTARAHSATLLTNNPNAYFYRHVAPHEEQVTHSQLLTDSHFATFATCRNAKEHVDSMRAHSERDLFSGARGLDGRGA